MSTVPPDGGLRRPRALFLALAFAIASAVVAVRVIAIAADPSLLNATMDAVKAIMAEGGYTNLLTLIGKAVHRPFLIGIFFYAGAPTLAALIVAGLGGGGGLRRLFGRLLPWGPDGRRANWAWTYVWLGAIYAACIALFIATGAGPSTLLHFGPSLPLAAAGLLIAPFIDEGGTLEELGWRGFLFPLMDRPSGWLAPALMLGVIHWAWHLPREVLTFMQGVDPLIFVSGQSVFLILCLALGVLCTLGVRASGGSALPAIAIHGGTNALSKGLGADAPHWGPIDLRTLVVIFAAVVVIGLYRISRLQFADKPQA